MGEWWTYSLQDFLLFSPRTYYRLFETYNEAVWPLHVAAAAMAVTVLWLVYRATPFAARIVGVLLAMTWFWVGIAFFDQRYATINWAADYFAIGFVLQAFLLLWHGLVAKVAGLTPSRLGLALLLFAVLVLPLSGLIVGREWSQAELFGLAPDPTALATLALLAMSTGRIHYLVVIPLMWCVVSGLTLFAMEAPDAMVMPLAAVLSGFAIISRRNRRGDW